MKFLLPILVAAAAAVCTAQRETIYEITDTAAVNLVEVLGPLESFSTLVALLVTADLVGTLKLEGPYTVLAPNNDAVSLKCGVLLRFRASLVLHGLCYVTVCQAGQYHPCVSRRPRQRGDA
jgi:hypothetical protein